MKHRITEGKQILNEIENNYKHVQDIYLCSPYLTLTALEPIFKILDKKTSIKLIVITKYDPLDILLGSTDKRAFHYLFEKNKKSKYDIKIHIVNNLHSKVLLLGTRIAILGSANITFSGLNRNRELGIAIYDKDSKIFTIRNYLKKYIASGYIFTHERFDWLEKNHLIKFENRALAIKSLVKNLKREYEAGLNGFISTNRDEIHINYFSGVVSFLKYIDENGCTNRDQCLLWLTDKSINHGNKINQDRLSLLLNMGLIIEDHSGIALTGDGKHITQKESKDYFYQRLLAIFPEFEHLEILLAQKGIIHATDIAANNELNGGQAYWEGRLRWMQSLDRVVPFVEKKKKFYKLK